MIWYIGICQNHTPKNKVVCSTFSVLASIFSSQDSDNDLLSWWNFHAFSRELLQDVPADVAENQSSERPWKKANWTTKTNGVVVSIQPLAKGNRASLEKHRPTQPFWALLIITFPAFQSPQTHQNLEHSWRSAHQAGFMFSVHDGFMLDSSGMIHGRKCAIQTLHDFTCMLPVFLYGVWLKYRDQKLRKGT